VTPERSLRAIAGAPTGWLPHARAPAPMFPT